MKAVFQDHAGVRHEVDLATTAMIGSAADVAIRLPAEQDFPGHLLRVVRGRRGITVEPLSQRIPIFLDERPLTAPMPLANGNTLRFGAVQLSYLGEGSLADFPPPEPARPAAASTTPSPQPPSEAKAPQTTATGSGFVTSGKCVLGREENQVDVRLDHPTVARRHAELDISETRVRVRDLGTDQGTFVNGERISGWVELKTNDRVDIGPFTIRIGGDQVSHASSGAPTVSVQGVCRIVGGGKSILNDVSLQIPANTFVAIIGPSGSGKSTLLKAVSAREPASRGVVNVNGTSLYGNFRSLKESIAFVPQQEVLHNELSLRDALRYTARLRLPRDSTRADIDECIGAALERVELTPQLSTRISHLSGGQRKRASLASEIIARPSLLFLDEVTSGLDDLSDWEVMKLCRGLSEDQMTVLCVTHNLTNVLDFCHRLVVLAPPGELAYFGPAKDALCYFKVDKLADIYRRLNEKPGHEWKADFLASANDTPDTAEALAAVDNPEAAQTRHVGLTRAGHQLWVLMQRNLRKLLADHRTTISATIQSAMIAVLISVAFGGNLDSPAEQSTMLFLASVSVFWIGCNFAAKEIVRELPIFVQERNTNLSVTSYLGAKFATNVIFNTFQVAVVVAGILLLCELPGDLRYQIPLLLLTNSVGVAMGLLLSAASQTQAQATTLVPLVLIPQIVFSGAIIPELPELVNLVAESTVSVYWSLDGLQAALQEQHSETRWAGSMLGMHLGVLILAAWLALLTKGRSAA
ncbi:MAG: ATP-binding cassette domain-containing protein [Pseudomonadota bacterium]